MYSHKQMIIHSSLMLKSREVGLIEINWYLAWVRTADANPGCFPKKCLVQVNKCILFINILLTSKKLKNSNIKFKNIHWLVNGNLLGNCNIKAKSWLGTVVELLRFVLFFTRQHAPSTLGQERGMPVKHRGEACHCCCNCLDKYSLCPAISFMHGHYIQFKKQQLKIRSIWRLPNLHISAELQKRTMCSVWESDNMTWGIVHFQKIRC